MWHDRERAEERGEHCLDEGLLSKALFTQEAHFTHTERAHARAHEAKEFCYPADKLLVAQPTALVHHADSYLWSPRFKEGR